LIVLSPETEKLWEFLKPDTALSGFVLVGGSALALRINHRRSEDLDLAFLGQKLPRKALDLFYRKAAHSGYVSENIDIWQTLRLSMK
jgi:hypothetical protein